MGEVVSSFEENGGEGENDEDLHKEEMEESEVGVIKAPVDLPGESVDGILELLELIDHFYVLYQHLKIRIVLYFIFEGRRPTTASPHALDC